MSLRSEVRDQPPTSSDEARKPAASAAKEAEKAKAKEQQKNVEAYKAGKLKVPTPTSSDEAKKIGGAVAKESEKGAAPAAPPKEK